MLGYHTAKSRVRFGQTDRYGYTWHGHLPTFLEEGRADFARRYCLGTDVLLGHRLSIPVIELAIEYCHASHEEEELAIQLTLLRPIMKLPGFAFVYRLFGGRDGSVEIARARTRQVLLNGGVGFLAGRSPLGRPARDDEVAHAHGGRAHSARTDDGRARGAHAEGGTRL
jgi:YbgC/YbaW family acyl-CoA thioester hydrolase